MLPLSASLFPNHTPLNAFFAWNEARRDTDWRYRMLCRVSELLRSSGNDVCLDYLGGRPREPRPVAGSTRLSPDGYPVASASHASSSAAAQRVIDSFQAAVGASDTARHAAVFQAIEELAQRVEIKCLIDGREQTRVPRIARPRSVLVIKLGALGDFIQALGPVPAIRHHHVGDRLFLLTTRRYAEFARQTGLFDEVLIDRRPRPTDVAGWLALRRLLRAGNFDRVYDLQTSDRSNLYFRLLWPGQRPEWSGTARGCSHPHANLGRDRQHTMDRQAEQLMMAGIHPVGLIPSLPTVGKLPAELNGRRFALLIPGSSPRRLAKRWPADRYGELARRLHGVGCLPVVVGVAGEEMVGRAICRVCPDALDLVGRTDVAGLAVLAQAAALTVGNDTGATHVAAAGGHPIVVLFSRASSPDLCAPRGAAVRVLSEPNLADLPVESVLAAGLAAIGGAERTAAWR